MTLDDIVSGFKNAASGVVQNFGQTIGGGALQGIQQVQRMANPVISPLPQAPNPVQNLLMDSKSFMKQYPSPASFFLNQQIPKPLATTPSGQYQPTSVGQYLFGQENVTNNMPDIQKIAATGLSNLPATMALGVGEVPTGFSIPRALKTSALFAGAQAVAGEKPQDILSSLPLTLAMGGLGPKEAPIKYNGQTIEQIKQSFSPDVRADIGAFAQKVEENPNINRANLGSLGDRIQTIAETTFGKDAANLTNRQLKNLFDVTMQQAFGNKPMPENYPIGLQAKPIRSIEEAEAMKVSEGPGPLPWETPGSPEANKIIAEQQKAATPISQEVTSFQSKPKQKQYLENGPNLNTMTTQDNHPINPSSPYMNTSHFNIEENAQRQLNETAEAIKPDVEAITGKKISNKEVIETARSSRIITDPKTRQQQLDYMAQVNATGNKLAQLAKDGTLTKEYLDTLKTWQSLKSSAGRNLQIFNSQLDPASKSLMADMIEKLQRNGVSNDEILKQGAKVDWNDPIEVAKFYREYVKPNAENWIDLVRYNSMLSSPITHLVNATSNAINVGIYRPLTQAVTGGIDFIRAGITRQPRTAFVGEMPAYYEGVVKSMGEASQAWGEAMRGGGQVGKFSEQNIPLATKGVAGAAEKGLSLPARLLTAADNFFTTLAKGGEESAAYFRADRGIGTDNPSIIQDQALARARQTIYTSPTHPGGQGPLLESVDHLTDTVNNLRNSPSGILRWMSKYTLPFVRIASNMFKAGLESNPVTGLATMIGAANPEEQLAKTLIGTSVAIGAAGLLGSGRLTADAPTDPRTAAAFYKSGRQPWSVKWGDHWVSYDKLPPVVAWNFALMSSIDQAQTEGKISGNTADILLNSMAHFGSYLANASYLKTVGDIYNGIVLKDAASNPARIATNYVSQLVPYRALMGWITNMSDDTKRKVDTTAGFADQMMQNMMMQIPGLSQKVPPMVDSQGNIVQKTNPLWANFSPLKVSTPNPNPQTAQQNENLYQHDIVRQLLLGQLPKGELISQPGQPAQYAPDLQSIANTIPKVDPANPQARMTKYNTLLMYPQIFQFLQNNALQDAKGDMSKVDPLYTAPNQVANDYMRAESLPPNDPYAKAIFKQPEVIGLIKARSDYFAANPIPPNPNAPTTIMVGNQVQQLLSPPVASARAQQLMNMQQWNDPEVQAYLNASTAYKNQQLGALGMNPLLSTGTGQSRSQIIGAYRTRSMIRKAMKTKVGMGKRGGIKGINIGTKLTKTPSTTIPFIGLKQPKGKSLSMKVPKGRKKPIKLV